MLVFVVVVVVVSSLLAVVLEALLGAVFCVVVGFCFWAGFFAAGVSVAIGLLSLAALVATFLVERPSSSTAASEPRFWVVVLVFAFVDFEVLAFAPVLVVAAF